ncbi:glycosyltransferase [Acidovorax sp. BL-A-41-H1]|uniref:glycosyltransferase n=1 Tax=Acidovorax sp. BL-A-41-H1 TaxID=3421102 RepID=UPI003F7AC567
MRVMHFVTGGFSGATQVAVDLCLAARSAGQDVVLVLRKKRTTTPARVNALRAQGLDVRIVPGWAHIATIWAVRALALQWRPDVLVAHGYSEHLWGRYAGLLARVPRMVHVEHNSRERYTRWRLKQALWLAERTAATVGVSEGVREQLVLRGFPADRCVAIPNGIDLQRFPEAALVPFAERAPGIIMAARFARQKDHATLIEAAALLKAQGLNVPVYLAGGGKARIAARMQALAQQKGVTDEVQFLGAVADLPQRLMQHPLFVLSTHYEGMPLALVEGMAAGCACVASDVVGVRGVIEHGKTGLLVPEGDAAALAAAIARLLGDPGAAAAMGQAARHAAQSQFGLGHMHAGYQALLERVHAGVG